MSPALLPVLPCVLEHLIPVVPHVFDVSRSSNYESITRYCPTSRCPRARSSVAFGAGPGRLLCSAPQSSRPWRSLLEISSYLDILDDGVTSDAAFLYTLRARPEPGRIDYLICLAEGDASFTHTAEEVLALCPGVTTILFTTRTDLASCLSGLGTYPSVRVFGHWGKGKDEYALPAIDRCFPNLELLQVLSLRADSWMPQPVEPAIELSCLRNLHILPSSSPMRQPCASSRTPAPRSTFTVSVRAHWKPSESARSCRSVTRYTPGGAPDNKP
ncbi:hypothetical protein AURDEDRAFT_165182 [Auricularia subglabra TFB-10046 SS5]|nr:hypothetical protein AURDEDRAFT_165182 [Auricularia subglabra TFB-10046 SS5]